MIWDLNHHFRYYQAQYFKLTKFKNDFNYFKSNSQLVDNRFFKVSWKERCVLLSDDTSNTDFERHYVYFPAWAARVLKIIKPQKLVDISSSLRFVAVVSAFIPTDFYDYRPAPLVLSNLSTKKGDLMDLPFADNSLPCVSCMHVVEHIGLGRYGDPIDYDGDLKAMSELSRVLAKAGSLLFVVPLGKPRIVFNAHRIYSYEQVISGFPELTLKEFALIPENSKDGGLVYNPAKSLIDKQTYGCGCFWFTK